MADRAEIASRRTEQALNGAGLEDPRPALRDLLRSLRTEDSAAFEDATARYEQVLVPAAADEDGDPLAAWLDYGSWLAARVAAGATVVVDATGRSRASSGNIRPGELYLHLPSDPKRRAVLLLVPREPSGPQRETIDLLVG